MRRSLALVVVLGVAALAAASALYDREVAFEVGLPAVREAAELEPGERVCRDDVFAAADFERVRVVVGTRGRPGPALRIDAAGASGTVPPGYPDNSSVEAAVGPVRAGGPLELCVANQGRDPMVLFGAPPDTPPALLDDPDREALPAFVFLRAEPRSMLSLVPEAFERAARFKAGWIGPWTLWVLLGVAGLAVPAALMRALYASECSSSRSEPDAPSS